ncbi:unnamed protein product [Cylindrotheca closterium]|uniref:Uncharacterized protein n=1 Tax=Cylindrotheca closterium TaxID=2856 RepID=A0AAD2G858_9STRA|nr:unnamed protein product [Cylindrotheca closterium]
MIGKNNEAIAFLRNQEFSQAIEALSAALKCLRSLQCVAPHSMDCCDERYAHCSDYLDQCMLLSKVDESNTEANNEEFIYRHGIMLHSEVADADIITTILLFNTAIAYHMLAIEQRRHQVLQKARRLYELAYNACGDLDDNILFQFVVINNIFIIDRKLGNKKAMPNDCLAHLLSLFMILVDQGHEVHLRHVQGFLVNLPSTADAAVAA